MFLFFFGNRAGQTPELVKRRRMFSGQKNAKDSYVSNLPKGGSSEFRSQLFTLGNHFFDHRKRWARSEQSPCLWGPFSVVRSENEKDEPWPQNPSH